MKHILSSRQFDKKTINKIFTEAGGLEKDPGQPLKGKIMATLFYEPSTRTRFSFESAMIKLGGNVISSENAKEFSSAAKGETVEDTVRVVGNFTDVIVIRHYEKGSAERAAAVSKVPIINAGDGAGEHPTQALLDLYTIQKELGKIDGIKIAFAGDLKNGRTVRSLSELLSLYKDVEIYFISPKQLKINQDTADYLKASYMKYEEMESWDQALPKVDVIYQTRVQKERFVNPAEYEKYKGKYVITLKEAGLMKKGSIIMHPLPRVDEIILEVDSSPKAAYFKQAQNGLFVRMALLKMLLTDNL